MFCAVVAAKVSYVCVKAMIMLTSGRRKLLNTHSENCALTKLLQINNFGLNSTHEKILDSDWVRAAVQFKCNTGANKLHIVILGYDWQKKK